MVSTLLLSFLVHTDGDRDCPSAIEEWTREVLYDQFLFLLGEVAREMRPSISDLS